MKRQRLISQPVSTACWLMRRLMRAGSCETFVVCACGFDPTAAYTSHRYENIWGEIDKEAATVALACWNESIAANY